MSPRLPVLVFGLATFLPLLPHHGPDSCVRAEPPSGKQRDQGKSLWDGKSLKGWKSADYVGSGKIAVRDGAIILEKGKPMTGIVYDGRDFPTMDYEVTLEGKRVAGSDFFCTTTFPVGDSYCSFVAGGWGGSTIGLSNVNFSDASENETSKSKEFENNRWYRFRIRVSKQRIETWIDDEKVVDLETKDRKISTRIECDACQPFGIATYDTTGAIRNLRVRRLSSKP